MLWLGLVLILPLMYLYQLVPHTHAAHQHDQSHEAQVPHTNHSHDDNETDLPESAHHHHALTNHLDTHISLLHNPRSSPDTGISIGVVTEDHWIFFREPQFWAPDLLVPPPKGPPNVASGPRAPPLQG